MKSQILDMVSHFVLFGFSRNSEWFVNHHIPTKLNIFPKRIEFGETGDVFFYSSAEDVAESKESIVFTSGFLRSKGGLQLSAQQILEQKLILPNSSVGDLLSGNGTVVCISKLAPEFWAYQTLMALPQLYYFEDKDSIVCSNNLKILLALVEKIEINQNAIPMHFLFRLAVGNMTYFKNIWRLFPGQRLRWHDGKLDVKLVHTFRQIPNVVSFNGYSSQTIDYLDQSINHVIQSYLKRAREPVLQTATLLSGGVDSSLIQAFVKESLNPGQAPLSISFAVQAASHKPESMYARYASEVLGTRHTFFTITPQDYPDLLIKALHTLGQPNLHNEGNVCYLALAEFLATKWPDIHWFFAGQGADALFGISEAKKVKLFQMVKFLPGAKLVLELAAQVLAPFASSKAHGLREVAAMLAEADKPASLMSPLNFVALSTQLEWVKRCFSERVLQGALEYRQELEEQYLGTHHCLEKIHMIDLLTAAYEPAVIEYHFFSMYNKQLNQIFMDQDIIHAVTTFEPDIRFIHGFTTKPLPKWVLTRRGLAALASKKKLGSTFNQDLYDWMKQGPLCDMVRAIELPGFVSKTDFEEMIQDPGPFLFSLLTFDIFKKQLGEIK